MKSWDINKMKYIKTPEKVINFLNEIDNICEKYNLSISHEDMHGAFILEKYDEHNIKWLKNCLLNLAKESGEIDED